MKLIENKCNLVKDLNLERIGKNFCSKFSDEDLLDAQNSLKSMLGVRNASGQKRFLDVGSGSGLFSLAARNLKADVCSFDFDDSSVWCTDELRLKFHRSK